MITRIVDKRVNEWHLIIEYDTEKDRYHTYEFFTEHGFERKIMSSYDKTLEEAKSAVSSTFKNLI